MTPLVLIKKTLKPIFPYKAYFGVLKAIWFLKSLKYAGDKHHCSFCNGKFSAFLPLGINNAPIIKEKQIVGCGLRENAQCPRCYSTDRERLVYFFLKKCKPFIFSDPIELLHIAPELNLSKKLKVSKNISYISGGLNYPLAQFEMDITDLKQSDNTYDAIICNHVLEHVPDDSKAMNELYRVLKKGGFAILQVPLSYCTNITIEDDTITSNEARLQAFGQADHVRIYGLDYFTRLNEVGFITEEIDLAKNMSAKEIETFRLPINEKIILCSKP